MNVRFGGKVYPRVGGGNLSVSVNAMFTRGLSPRGRGKHRNRAAANHAPGSIPAWAGETSSSNLSRCALTVYPRVGGGNSGR